MSRTWRHIGFTSHADILLYSYKRFSHRERVECEYPNGDHTFSEWRDVYVPDFTRTVIGRDVVWFGDGPDIERIERPNGNVWVSFVQASPWASGPVTFMAWKDEKTGKPIPGTLWKEEEINFYL